MCVSMFVCVCGSRTRNRYPRNCLNIVKFITFLIADAYDKLISENVLSSTSVRNRSGIESDFEYENSGALLNI